MCTKWFSKQHQEAFELMIEESYLTAKEIKEANAQLRCQLAFVYLISYYQADYAHDEGDTFYLDQGEVLSLGGPTYLLEEGVCGTIKPHETILKYAKALLKGDFECEVLEEVHQEMVVQAKKIAQQGMA